MWSIVCFIEENTVECIPNFWFKNNKCAWPSSKNKINSRLLVERRTAPNQVDFNFFQARLLATNINNLTKAYKKLKQAEDTSELSTFENDISEENSKSSKHINNNSKCISNVNKKNMIKMTANKIPSVLRSPPKYIHKAAGDKNKNNSKTTSNVKTMVIDQVTDGHYMAKDNGSDEEFIVNSDGDDYAPLRQQCNSNSDLKSSIEKNKSPFKWSVSASNSPVIDKQKLSSPIQKSWIITPVKLQTTETPTIQCKKKLDFYSEPILLKNIGESVLPKITKKIHTVQSGNDQSGLNVQSEKTSSGDLINKLYRTVVSLKYDIKEILIKLDRIENKATDNVALLSMTQELHGNEQEDAILWNFPITSLDEIALFEEKLLDRSFRLKMVKYLSLMVRNSVSETVRQILSRMFINEVLSKYSFVGQKKKLSFSILNSCTVIFDAIRNIKRFKDTPSLMIEKPFKDYLAGAKFRDLKKKKNEDNVTNTI